MTTRYVITAEQLADALERGLINDELEDLDPLATAQWLLDSIADD